MAGSSRSGGVATSRPKTSVRGTMTSATVVSPSSKTPWIISRSLRWTTPSWWPTSTRVRSSASVIAALATPSPSAARETRRVKAPSRRRTGREEPLERQHRARHEQAEAVRHADGDGHREHLAEDDDEEDHDGDRDPDAAAGRTGSVAT